MKTAVFAILSGFLAMLPLTQTPDRPASRGQSGARAERPEDNAPLTAEQIASVKAILAHYDKDSLTAADARAINEAFRAAGLRNSPPLQEAIREAGFDPETLGRLAPPPDGGPGSDRERGQGQRRGRGGETRPDADGTRPGAPPRQGGGDAEGREGRPARGGGYSIEQAVSDRAQLNTIAFSGLAFLTGSLGCNTFLPPGKVADYCGFQYMRDVDTNSLGHNTSFVPRAANNVLFILTEDQKAKLVALGREQEARITEFAYRRFPLIQAFCRQLEGNFPAGCAGLNREAVKRYTADLYALDGALSYRRAQVLGEVIRSFSAEQKAFLGRMSFSDSSTWPERGEQLDRKSLPHTVHVAVMTYASELFSWYAGNVEADVYFCPERHATYFGSFYMKDIPAMGNPDYSISTSLTGDSGEAFLAALAEEQRARITGLVEAQRSDLQEIVRVRRQIAMELRKFQFQPTASQETVETLSRRYGELDGEISYLYAKAFAEVAGTLTADQRNRLNRLRNLDTRYDCRGAYLFSRAIDMPAIPDTDFLFSASGASPEARANTGGGGGKTPSPRTVGPAAAGGSFRLGSPAVADGGALPRAYTGDGEGTTLPLEWAGAPAGTANFAVIMHHVAPDGEIKWYWILYNIPASARRLPRNGLGGGLLGSNSVNGRDEYAPPHSKGPGPKTYVLTVYALSGPVAPGSAGQRVTRDSLLTAMAGKILASAELRVIYSRSEPFSPESQPAAR